jgi:glycosyltransferase involved in cell wall biosynthesis
MKKIKICFVGANPNFDGGITLFQKNLIDYMKHTKIPYEITWVYQGEKTTQYSGNGVNYVQLKTQKIIFVEDILFNRHVLNFLKKNDFDIINSHAIWGNWIKNYKKRPNQKIIHTYHGTAYYFLKNSSKRFGILKRIILLPLLWFAYLMEKPPMKKADTIICVSEKVKKQLEILYNSKRKIEVMRTGVNLKDFKPLDKEKAKEQLKLDIKNRYGLYIGRGGYWTKGLDRAINLSEQIYKKDKNYRLIIIGSDYNKVKHLLNKNFIIFLDKIPRDKIHLYYSASDFFFCLSRYEGGAPTLVVSEAMASGCFLVCSKDSEQEIIENNKNGLIIKDFNENDAEKIINFLNNKKKKEEIIKNSIKTIKEFSLKKWGEKYLKILLK